MMRHVDLDRRLYAGGDWLDDRAAIIYEIGVVDGVLAPVVVHAMKARDRFVR
jgi:hypothetical protein